MPSLNTVVLCGNLTRDPEMRHTTSGTAVADFTLAVNRKRKDKPDEVAFIDVTCWEKLAQNVTEYCDKGSPVLVEGRLTMDEWQDKETGKKRSKLKVTAYSVQFLGKATQQENHKDDQEF